MNDDDDDDEKRGKKEEVEYLGLAAWQVKSLTTTLWNALWWRGERTSENGEGTKAAVNLKDKYLRWVEQLTQKPIRAGGRTSEWKREKFNFMG